jgi:hypothetical protein
MSDHHSINDMNELRKADRHKKDEDTINNRPHGIGWGPRGMRKGGWTGYGVYWGKKKLETEDGDDKKSD